MKQIRKFTAAALSAILSMTALLPLQTVRAAEPLPPVSLTESTETITNPGMGYTTTVWYRCKPENTPVLNPTGALVLMFVDIAAFSSGENGTKDADGNYTPGTDYPLDAAFFEGLRGTLENCRRNGSTVALRFRYDDDGTRDPEPATFEMLKDHIRQIGEDGFLRDYQDILMFVESGFVGCYGEQWGGKYCSLEQKAEELARKYGAGVQTHLVESLWEAQESVRLYPDCGSDTGIYEQAGLLGNGPVIGAHFIFPREDDIRLMKKYGGYAVQCPDSTMNIIAGIMRTGTLSDEGVKIGLGSDLAGGSLFGIYTQAARSVQLSKLKEFYEPDDNRAISFAQAFWMATRHGGALFGNVGSLEKGYAFDALVISKIADPFHELSPAEIVERFCYLGETRHIKARYLAGKKL